MNTSSSSERLDRLRLIRSQNVGPAIFRLLMRRFGSASTALERLPELSHRAGGRRIKICPKARAQAEMEKLHSLNGSFIMLGDADYPATLAALDDMPPILSVIGHAHIMKKTCIAIVGTRNASAAALAIAGKIAASLSRENHIIVSGMALGIDTISHKSALNAGTIAVLGGGVDVIYPPQNKDLYDKISETGCIVSEMRLGTQPRAQHFPRRNRIISGLSLVSVIVEAPMRSGAMITARLAGEQGRLICAVPGSPIDPRAKGTNQLIRDGATLVETGEDVLREIAPLIHQPLAEEKAIYDAPLPDFPEPTQDHYHQIMSLLGPAATDLDQIIRLSCLSASLVNIILTDLELAGRIHRDFGNRISLITDLT